MEASVQHSTFYQQSIMLERWIPVKILDLVHLTLDRSDGTAGSCVSKWICLDLLSCLAASCSFEALCLLGGLDHLGSLWALCLFSNTRCCVIEPQENKVMFSLQASLTVPAGGELRITVSCQSKNSSLTHNDDRMQFWMQYDAVILITNARFQINVNFCRICEVLL